MQAWERSSNRPPSVSYASFEVHKENKKVLQKKTLNVGTENITNEIYSNLETFS